MQEVLATHSLLSLFGAEALSLSDFTKINDQIKPVAYFGLPIIVLGAILEIVHQVREKKQEQFDHKESVFSIFVGMGWFASSYFTKAIMFAGIVWVYNIVPWRMELNWCTTKYNTGWKPMNSMGTKKNTFSCSNQDCLKLIHKL